MKNIFSYFNIVNFFLKVYLRYHRFGHRGMSNLDNLNNVGDETNLDSATQRVEIRLWSCFFISDTPMRIH